MVAVTPESNLSQTLQERPSMMFFVPEGTAKRQAVLMLRDRQGAVVYAKQLRLPAQAGFLEMDMAQDAKMPPLVPDQLYTWSFRLGCDQGSIAQADRVNGVLQRLNLPTLFQSKNLSPQEQQLLRQGTGMAAAAKPHLAPQHSVTTFIAADISTQRFTALDSAAQAPAIKGFSAKDLLPKDARPRTIPSTIPSEASGTAQASFLSRAELLAKLELWPDAMHEAAKLVTNTPPDSPEKASAKAFWKKCLRDLNLPTLAQRSLTRLLPVSEKLP
jgi:hypothetical protein